MSAAVPGPGSGKAGVSRRVLPGFGPSLGFTIVYLSLLVLIPLAGVFLRASGMTGASPAKPGTPA